MKLNLRAVKVRMAEMEINQKMLAGMAGIEVATLSRVFRNTVANVSLPTVGKIAKALNVPVTEIIMDED